MSIKKLPREEFLKIHPPKAYEKQKLGRPLVDGANRISRSWRISEKLDKKIMEIAAHAGVDPVDVVRIALAEYQPKAEHFEMLRKAKS